MYISKDLCRMLALAIAVLLVSACPGPPPPASPVPAPPPPEAPAVPEARCEGPCTIETVEKATLEVPQSFTAVRRGNVVELLEPDKQVKLAVVELAQKEGQSSLAAAVAEAWAVAFPGQSWKPAQTLSPPPADGYDELYVETYVPTKDRTVAQAVVRRKAKLMWVSLLYGPAPALDKRAAQLRAFLGSLKAPGVKKEDLAAKEPTPLGERTPELQRFIKRVLLETGTPGLVLAVVEGGKVVLNEGYGVREVGLSDPVTPETLMMIGSVSKSLTTLMMASLVDEGKLAWDRKVTDVEPTFRLADEVLSRELTMEMLVCACAGLPRKDLPLILAFKGKDAPDVLKELSGMAPSTGLRETFQYQNHMVAAGGFLSARAADPQAPLGQAYDQAMARRVFAPLGMTSTTLDHRAALKVKNRATPHSMDLDGQHRVVPIAHEEFARYIRPSGGIWTTSTDMARYLLMELAKGNSPDGKRLWSEANLLKRREPQVKVSDDMHYGLGWLVAKKKGLAVVSHGGGTMGFATTMTFLPDKGLGVVMIANGTGGHLAETVIWKRLMELWFASDEKADSTLEFALQEQKKELAKLKARLSGPTAEFMQPFEGQHQNPEIGTVIIKKAGQSGYQLQAGDYLTELKRHDRQDGQSVLIFMTPPLAGLELIPIKDKPGQSFEMVRGQERYVFSPKK